MRKLEAWKFDTNESYSEIGKGFTIGTIRGM